MWQLTESVYAKTQSASMLHFCSPPVNPPGCPRPAAIRSLSYQSRRVYPDLKGVRLSLLSVGSGLSLVCVSRHRFPFRRSFACVVALGKARSLFAAAPCSSCYACCVFCLYVRRIIEANLVNLAGSRDSKSVIWDEFHDHRITIDRWFPRLPPAGTD